jgi:DNA modification methylase
VQKMSVYARPKKGELVGCSQQQEGTVTTRTTKQSHQHPRTRSALLKQLAFNRLLMLRELELIEQNPLYIFQCLRRIGKVWKRIKKLLTRLGLNIDKWADKHLSITRQWADKHAELDTKWREFIEALEWAQKIGWEPDRKPSIKKALDMMEAKGRYLSIVAANDNYKRQNQKATPLPNERLDISLVDFCCGDALAELKKLPDESVHTCLTSPPYWGGFRDYGHKNQIGLEANAEDCIKKIVEILREVERVLTSDGTLWLVLGDAYKSAGERCEADDIAMKAIAGTKQGSTGPHGQRKPLDHSAIARKGLMLMPARVALALMADARLTLRSEIIVEKSSVYPQSVKDRPTRNHEFIYLFSKGQSYFYNGDAIKEPAKNPPSYPGRPPRQGIISHQKPLDYLRRWGDPSERNARTVWRFGVKPYRGTHPATFPEELAERCLRATLPPGGVAIDPFAGAGTTAIAALRLGASRVILVDLNRKYLKEARMRIASTSASPIPPPSGPMVLNPSVTLYRGDCRDILPALPDGSFDVVIADPPYFLRIPEHDTLTDFHVRNNGWKPRRRVAWDKFHSVDDYSDFTEVWLGHAFRLLHEKGSLFVFCNQHNIGFINYTFQRLGIQFVNHIVWCKPNGVPNVTGRRLACRHETIIWGIKQPGYRFRYKDVKATAYSGKEAGIQAHDVWTIPHITMSEAVGHPAQKPLALYQRLLDMCGAQGGTLLDPFGGSGTAAIAAMRWGMRSVLIEREITYIDMIKKRVANDNFKSGVASPNASNDNAKDPTAATGVAGKPRAKHPRRRPAKKK